MRVKISASIVLFISQFVVILKANIDSPKGSYKKKKKKKKKKKNGWMDGFSPQWGWFQTESTFHIIFFYF